MARPSAKELTERELQIMHQFWKLGETTVADVRESLAVAGLELAQTTVGTLVRILVEKGFLEQTAADRPARYKPIRSFEEVSRSLVGEMLDRVFLGSREGLLQCLFGGAALSAKDRKRMLDMLKDEAP
jgi:predicted transcriptional regulator